MRETRRENGADAHSSDNTIGVLVNKLRKQVRECNQEQLQERFLESSNYFQTEKSYLELDKDFFLWSKLWPGSHEFSLFLLKSELILCT